MTTACQRICLHGEHNNRTIVFVKQVQLFVLFFSGHMFSVWFNFLPAVWSLFDVCWNWKKRKTLHLPTCFSYICKCDHKIISFRDIIQAINIQTAITGFFSLCIYKSYITQWSFKTWTFCFTLFWFPLFTF